MKRQPSPPKDATYERGYRTTTCVLVAHTATHTYCLHATKGWRRTRKENA